MPVVEAGPVLLARTQQLLVLVRLVVLVSHHLLQVRLLVEPVVVAVLATVRAERQPMGAETLQPAETLERLEAQTLAVVVAVTSETVVLVLLFSRFRYKRLRLLSLAV